VGSAVLAIDVGNTQTLAGVFQEDTLLHEWRISTERGATADELAAAHDQILRLRGGSLDELDAMIVSSVVPAVTVGYTRLAEKYMERPALVVGPGIRTGMPLLIDTPRELGADRLVNAVAAFHRVGGPCIVVDFGTATTFDAVSASGEYLGGVIASGVETSLDALTNRAARLVKVDLVPPEKVIGRSTVESMRSGLILGAVAMMEGLVDRMRIELGGEAAVVATGGLAATVCALTDRVDLHEPMLTLDGLRIIYRMNVGARGTQARAGR
jgi:type III pantothenate kinase